MASITKTASGTLGRIPVGSLFTTINSTFNDLRLFNSGSERPLGKITALTSGLGFSIMPLSEICALGSSSSNSKTVVKLSVGLTINMILPGTTQAIPIVRKLGDIELKIPKLPILQICLMGHTAGPADTLIILDPDTRKFFTAPTQVLDSIKQVDGAIQTVLSAIDNLSVLDSKIFGLWSGLASTTSRMIQQFGLSAVGTGRLDVLNMIVTNDIPSMAPGMATGGFNQFSPSDWWWDGRDTDSDTNNISNLLWIGAPAERGTRRLVIFMDDRKSPTGQIHMPHDGSHYAVQFSSREDITPGAYAMRSGSNVVVPIESLVLDWYRKVSGLAFYQI